MSHDNKLETKTIFDIKGNFKICNYQRGYRWSEEVTRLRDDILAISDQETKNDQEISLESFFKSGPFEFKQEEGKIVITPLNGTSAEDQLNEKVNKYCLQPIVVKNLGDDNYELIDGQQRLTTLFLMIKAIKDAECRYIKDKKLNYSIIYETREDLKNNLETVNVNSEDKNIDFYFIKNAYVKIFEWATKKGKKNRDLVKKFVNNLEKYVEIIWYEVDKDEDSNALFERLNIGRIPLTNSELVKALFLCEASKNEIDEKKSIIISFEWDNIEKELSDDSFWYFLTNYENDYYQTRMDLILEIIARYKDYGAYATYFYFEKEKNKGKKLNEIWEDINKTYLTLKAWYKDNEFYHLIGYLISSNQSTIKDIYKMSENLTKTKFKEELRKKIRNSINLDEGKNYIDLSYEENSDKKELTKLLLLFNVVSVLNHNDKLDRFPFDRYKKDLDGNEKIWSLEHIDARHSFDLNNLVGWKTWLKDHIDYVKKIDINDEKTSKEKLINEMEEAINDKSLNKNKFNEIKQKIIDLSNDIASSDNMHSIANLALLDRDDNAYLSNYLFGVKRAKIIERDKEGRFIPFCTKMVFLKYYSGDDSSDQILFWSQNDRKKYIESINKVLYEGDVKYIKEKIEYGDDRNGNN